MTRDDRTRDERLAVMAAARAAWPTLYATVRDAIARGFWPSAYGGADPPALQKPPTTFSYPRGGLAHPHHADGPGAGARFRVWTHENGTPDDLAERTVWWAGSATAASDYGYLYRSVRGLTLAQALDQCVATAEHHLAHFIVPTWHEEGPELPIAAWREVADAVPPSPPQQLGLFADNDEPRTHLERVGRVIRQLLQGVSDDAPWILVPDYPGALYEVEQLIDMANAKRARRGVPAPEVSAA